MLLRKNKALKVSNQTLKEREAEILVDMKPSQDSELVESLEGEINTWI